MLDWIARVCNETNGVLGLGSMIEHTRDRYGGALDQCTISLYCFTFRFSLRLTLRSCMWLRSMSVMRQAGSLGPLPDDVRQRLETTPRSPCVSFSELISKFHWLHLLPRKSLWQDRRVATCGLLSDPCIMDPLPRWGGSESLSERS